MNRDQVKQRFAEYTSHYDSSDEKIKLKVNHTYRVAELSERIAQSLDMTKAQVDLAWLIGMLHDIGRFEQVKRYGTFMDAQSVDHAQFGADLLFIDGMIEDYAQEASPAERSIIELAIRNHNKYRVDDSLEEEVLPYCHILRDADKIDILRVNVESPLEDIYNTTTELLRTSKVSEEVMENFKCKKATPRAIRKVPVDYVVGHISLVYELVYDSSIFLVAQQGYLDQLMHFESRNPETTEQFAQIRLLMEAYVQGRCVKHKEKKK